MENIPWFTVVTPGHSHSLLHYCKYLHRHLKEGHYWWSIHGVQIPETGLVNCHLLPKFDKHHNVCECTETELTLPYHTALSTKRTVTVIVVYTYVILLRKWKNIFKKGEAEGEGRNWLYLEVARYRPIRPAFHFPGNMFLFK